MLQWLMEVGHLDKYSTVILLSVFAVTGLFGLFCLLGHYLEKKDGCDLESYYKTYKRP